MGEGRENGCGPGTATGGYRLVVPPCRVHPTKNLPSGTHRCLQTPVFLWEEEEPGRETGAVLQKWGEDCPDDPPTAGGRGVGEKSRERSEERKNYHTERSGIPR